MLFSIFDVANAFGGVCIGASVAILLYAVGSTLVKDETLYDLELLPSTDSRHISYLIEPEPDQGPQKYPTIFEDPEVYVSFVVPAYNEEKRLPAMLDETLDYLKARSQSDLSFTFEIIVVDDGSKDRTAEVVYSYANCNPEVRLLRQPYNMGKGAAIQAGCLHARGTMILMVDADGATKITEFGVLEDKLKSLQLRNREVIVVGSRSHLDGLDKAQRTPIRKFLGFGFHSLILMSGVRGIRDTQCGFKLFSREASKFLFPNQHIQRWCFDPELLVIGQKRAMEIAEVPVEWNEIDGSKMSLSGMIKMATDLVKIAIFHRIGFWSIRNREHDMPAKEEL